MSNKIYADLIFVYKPADFIGNNKVTQQISEALDGQSILLKQITFQPKPDNHLEVGIEKIKVSVEIETSFDGLNKTIADESQAEEFISDKISETALPRCTVLIDSANTEYNEETDDERDDRRFYRFA